LQAVLRARDLAPLDGRAQFYVAEGYYKGPQANSSLNEERST
jgi:hypothetical protein